MTIHQIVGLSFLFVFGWFYDKLIERSGRIGERDFTALSVIGGMSVICVVMYADSFDVLMAGQQFVWLLFVHLAAGGFWMTVGSFRRYRSLA